MTFSYNHFTGKLLRLAKKLHNRFSSRKLQNSSQQAVQSQCWSWTAPSFQLKPFLAAQVKDLLVRKNPNLCELKT
jgi:hypothetical protein